MLALLKKVTFIVLIIYSVFAEDLNNYRLPTSVRPVHYDIELTPYFPTATPMGKKEYTCDGLIKIRLRSTEFNVTKIVLHMNTLYISNTTLTSGTNEFTVSSLIVTHKTHKLTVVLESALIENIDYVLAFEYVAVLDDDMHGFYRSTYVQNDTVKWLGTTQFEPTYARRAFPCFDEPSFKATFSLIINRPIHFQPSFSNTQIISSTLINGRYREVFETTPIMSTYLLAFIVSEMAIRETNDKSFGVISRPDALPQTLYAFEVGQLLLKKLDEWTKYPYSSVPAMKKLHMAGLPDFSAGAMENWGLVTYRETALLYDPKESTHKAQQQVAIVIAHEQAHMWFGNLVTCEWWSYLWLNEGFATYFQYYALAMVKDKWELDLQFVLEELQPAFYADSFPRSLPMTFEVNSPNQIRTRFNTISYSKGAVVLRMIEHIMGSANFKTGIRAYLAANAFGTSTPEKLYAALQAQTHTINVAQFLNSWTMQGGYPVITVKRHADRQTVTVEQQRFLNKKSYHEFQNKWEIHLNYASPINKKFTDTSSVQVLRSDDESITFQLDHATDWVVFNVLQTGFYRVNYDAETWNNIIKALKANNHSGIHAINRAQIIDDVIKLASAGLIDYRTVFNTLQYLKTEVHYMPWTAALTNLEYITNRFNQEVTIEFKKFFVNLSKVIYKKLGFVEKSTDSRLDIYNRVEILRYNCKYGNEECIKFAKDEFAKLKHKGIPVPVNLRPIVYCTAVRYGHYAEYFALIQKYLYENVASEKKVILYALGCTSHQWILKNYLNFIFTDAVRLQDKDTAFIATFVNRAENVPYVLDFMTKNHYQITSMYGSPKPLLNMLHRLSSRFTTQEEIDKLQLFFDVNRPLFGESPALLHSITRASLNLEWASDHMPIIYEFLKMANSSATKFAINTLLICSISVFIMFKKFIL